MAVLRLLYCLMPYPSHYRSTPKTACQNPQRGVRAKHPGSPNLLPRCTAFLLAR